MLKGPSVRVHLWFAVGFRVYGDWSLLPELISPGELRRPGWACYSEMRAALPCFLELYDKRPIQNNLGGMQVDHSFAMFFTLRKLRPKVVIESGAFRGHGTWIIKQALPDARIISLDPEVEPYRRLDGVEYKLKGSFRDVAKIDWKSEGVDPAETIMFIDDHQSGYRRILELMSQGFTRFIFDDNYPYNKGDNYSLKKVCEIERQSLWRGTVVDNFSKAKYSVTWEYHLKHANFLPKLFRTYYEFPPLASRELSGATWDPDHTTAPIVSDPALFKSLGLAATRAKDRTQMHTYTHWLYVEINSDLGGEVPPPLCLSA